MKKLIFMLIISMSLVVVGCEKNTQIKDDSNTVDYSQNTETEGETQIYESSDKQDNNVVDKPKQKIQISSSLERIISEALYKMYNDNQSYDEIVNDDNLPMLAYSILNNYAYDDNSTMISTEDGIYMKVARDDVNQYIKAVDSSFKGQKLDDATDPYSGTNMMYYSEQDDSYYFMPADGAPWVAIQVLDAYNNNDGTYRTVVSANYQSNGGDDDFIGKYEITLVDNDSSSQFEYRISDIRVYN